MHKVLAIETSCDETSVSIVSNIGDTFRIHSNIIASQIEDHSKWGGVVPELAARKHQNFSQVSAFPFYHQPLSIQYARR